MGKSHRTTITTTMSRILITMLFAAVCFAAAQEEDFLVPESEATPEVSLLQKKEKVPLPPGVSKKNNTLPASDDEKLPHPAQTFPGFLQSSDKMGCRNKYSWCSKVRGDSSADSWSCYHRGSECRKQCCNCGRSYWKNYCGAGA